MRRPADDSHLLECARLVAARAVGLEVVVIPVSDVDRAKQFYSKQLGFNVDVDNRMGESFRNVQLTPPGLGVLGHHRHRAHSRLTTGRGRHAGRSSRTG